MPVSADLSVHQNPALRSLEAFHDCTAPPASEAGLETVLFRIVFRYLDSSAGSNVASAYSELRDFLSASPYRASGACLDAVSRSYSGWSVDGDVVLIARAAFLLLVSQSRSEIEDLGLAGLVSDVLAAVGVDAGDTF